MRQTERSTCSKVFSTIDITGPEVTHFTYNRSPKYKTGIGGFFSLLCILIIGGYSTFLLYRYWKTPYFVVDTITPAVTDKLHAVYPVIYTGTGDSTDGEVLSGVEERANKTFPGIVLEAPSYLKYTLEDVYNVTLEVTLTLGKAPEVYKMIDCTYATWADQTLLYNVGLTSKQTGEGTHRVALCPESGSVPIAGQIGTKMYITSYKNSSDTDA